MISILPAGGLHAQISALSTRSFVGTDDEVAVNVFYIGGTGTATVLVRALGPSLGGVVPDRLQNPTLTLSDASGNIIAFNNNWKDDQQQAIMDSGFAPASDLESAIVATLAPGIYTATERGNNSTTGVGLNELYDITPGGTAEVINFGARGRVDADNALVTEVTFLSPQDLFVRTLGPSLASFGLGGLNDPTLSLLDEMGDVVIQNDNWRDTQQNEIQALGLQPDNDSESAALRTIPAGTYTYVSEGKNGASGLVYGQHYDTNGGSGLLPPQPPVPDPSPSPTLLLPRRPLPPPPPRPANCSTSPPGSGS